MAFIDQISTDEPNDDVRQIYEQAQSRAGGVAKIIQIMSNDGKSAQASMAFYISIMKSKNGLSGAQKEMLATVVSNVNDCFY